MLLVLLAIILAMGGAMFLNRALTPEYGLDLAGGTTVTLQPITPNGSAPSEESLDLAVNIIRDRVNGSGISDAEVAKAGDNIVISVPGVGQEEVVKLVGTTAELRFRQVLAIGPGTPTPPGELSTQAPTPTPAASPTASPTSSGRQKAKATPTPTRPAQTAAPGPSGSPAGRALSSALTNPSPAPSATRGADASPSAKPRRNTPTPTATPKATATPDAGATPAPDQAAENDPLAGVDTTGIDPAALERFKTLDCAKENGQGAQDDPNKQYVGCGFDDLNDNDPKNDVYVKYILDKAALTGTTIDSASSGVEPNTGAWVVQLSFKGQGPDQWSKLTTTAFNSQAPRNQVAVVLDGVVISAPAIQEPITGGRAQITGGFTQPEADELANQLKYGALPLKFEKSSIDEVSSTLGADQLRGGLIAGGIGLLLVLVYSMLYYRGLGVVSVLSLVVATVLTYQSVVLLGEFANFRLSLPHIIGLIVSIGITADSFIVYFERIRDEMKEGRRSLRAAVEVAWVRARRTILIADAVMFIAAVVLYFLAVGGVAGFAFAMGLTTLIDIVVVFMFTKPFVALLARLRFFAKGHKLSGLDAERMSETTVAPKTAPQEA
ncbi:preprotein translocase subunit SecD [Streptosporangium becharense]|uniref:Protein translocase subunit SecD n=1 Tax=Streptosporangium becharense TaxID=1816182 RepID=A0A7W9IC88_9ACTN|nr:protein translocase subunit SecD [Streptosporangium becharense]MBB2914995.1 preprotein translocase subunit SecD [Streptosporangium becharense]MBB5818044.1 preprotein translocase subunit SecD [Streptosporangium becharense]